LAISLVLATGCEKNGVEAARDSKPALTGRQVLSMDDRTFLINAEQRLVRQRALADTAADESRNRDVRALAKDVIVECDDALTEARAVMKTLGMEPRPTLLEVARLQAKNRLRHATGTALDDKFLSLFTADQQEIIRRFDFASYTAANPDLRAYARQVLPVFRKEFATSVNLQRKVSAAHS